MMATGTILEAVEKLEAGTITKRKEGIEELERLLSNLRASNKLHKLGDDGWHKIVNVLFNLVKSDKHDLLSGSPSAKKRAANRLETIAHAFRLVVVNGHELFRRKIALAVLDHITDHMRYDRDNEEPFRRLVQADYLKAFCAVTANMSLGEHLRSNQWQKYVDFTLDGININIANELGEGTVDEDAMSVSYPLSTNGSVRSSFPVRPSQATSFRGPRNQEAQLMDDLIDSLCNLSSVTNCPLRSRLSDIARIALSVLSTSLQNKEVAFKCLNNVLMLARTEDVALVHHVAAQIFVLIQKIWVHKIDEKSMKLREQILATLLLIRPTLDIETTQSPNFDISTIETLCQHLSREYDKRRDRDRLQLSDISLTRSNVDDVFCRGGIGPNVYSQVATLNWVTLTMIVDLREFARQKQRHADDMDTTPLVRPTKRVRVAASFPDILYLLMVEEHTLEMQQIKEFLTDVVPSVTDDRSGSSSWILLVMSRLCQTAPAKHPELKELWGQAWNIISLLISSTINSRAACFAAMSLLRGDLLDHQLSSSSLVETCFNNGSRGPPSLSDAALMLFTACLESNLLENERPFAQFRDKVLSWLDLAWNLPPVQDYPHFTNLVQMGQPRLLYEILVALNGVNVHLRSGPELGCPMPLYRSYLDISDDYQFIGFLGGRAKDDDARLTRTKRVPHQNRSILCIKQSSGAVSAFLTKKLADLKNAFGEIEMTDCDEKAGKQLENKRRANLNLELAEILCGACTAASLAMDGQEARSDDSMLGLAWSCVLRFIELQRDNIQAFEAACVRQATLLLSVGMSDEAEDARPQMTKQYLSLISSLLKVMSTQNDSHIGENEMDLEFDSQGTASQRSQNKSQGTDEANLRRHRPFPSDQHSVFVQAHAYLLRQSCGPQESVGNVKDIACHFQGLSTEDFLTVRGCLLEWLETRPPLATVDVTTLLKSLAKVCLQSSEHERNEAALSFCLKGLQLTMPLWLDTEDEDLGDIALDIYMHFIDKVLKSGVASVKVLELIAHLLQDLLGQKPRYAEEVKGLQSPRTSLLEILGSATSALRFKIVPAILSLFDHYILTEHDKIYDDIVDCLPTEEEDAEGIAVRLYILARTGSRWKTVLRQAIYHIFETAANVPATMHIAHQAMMMIAQEIGLEKDTSRLFHLFAPQLMFTWLENGSIETLPYKVFGFDSLQNMVVAEETELVAQATLRQSSHHVRSLVSILHQPWPQLLRRNFALSQVYAIATDITETHSGSKLGPREQAMQDSLGQDMYTALSRKHYPQSAARLVVSLADDRGITKLFGSVPEFRPILHVYEDIQRRASSITVLPARQQPSFRAKNLLMILTRLSAQAGVEAESLWTPALFTFACRTIFDDASPALGPLHVSAMIRKIRLLVALNGSVAVKGYPLEMLLHNLRPYLTTFHCAEDAIGIFWYLVENGKTHLQKNMSFLTGLSVTVFASLAIFADSSQESTTQESQFNTTMSKAREFRVWLGTYLQTLSTSHLGGSISKRYEDIIATAITVTSVGTNDRQKPEGVLLHHLLLDQSSSDPLVPEQSFDLIIADLSKNFVILDSLQNDIFDKEEDVISCASVLYSILSQEQASGSFRIWIGNTLGRAYLAGGPRVNLSSGNHRSGINLLVQEKEDAYRRIVLLLAEKLWEGSACESSMAEQTLSYSLAVLSSAVSRKAILSGRPRDLKLEDMIFDAAQYPRSQISQAPSMAYDLPGNLRTFASQEQLAASIAELMVFTAPSDQFLYGLIPLLRSQHKLAAELLPPIAYIVLYEQAQSNQTSAREKLSRIFGEIATASKHLQGLFAPLILKTLLYLRQCKLPREQTTAQRNSWLHLDYGHLARAALGCGLTHAALLMVEIEQSEKALAASRGRRSSVAEGTVDQDLLSQIFQNVEDADFFYGAQQDHDMPSVMAKLRHEGQGQRLLAMQSAFFDSGVRRYGIDCSVDREGSLVGNALCLANMHGLAATTQQYAANNSNPRESNLATSLLNVHQWDLSSSESVHSLEGSILEVLSKVERQERREEMLASIHTGTLLATEKLKQASIQSAHGRRLLLHLAAITQMQQLIGTESGEELEVIWENLLTPSAWSTTENFDAISTVLTTREAVAAAMKRNEKSTEIFLASPSQLILHELQTVRSSLSIASKHNVSQFCLNRAAYLSDLQLAAKAANVEVTSAVMFDIANVLWSQGEVTAPIEMLKALQGVKEPNTGAMAISRAELLTDLGQKVSQARLDRPDEVTTHYLQPALLALGKTTSGVVAGRVYHNFAAFCDEQLHDSAAKDDFERITKIRNRKLQEVNELAEMHGRASGTERSILKSHYSKAKTWLKLDEDEYRRLKDNRDQLLLRCLQNYLASMRANDEYPNDVLRLLSLWLGNTSLPLANETVRKCLVDVPTIKLAPFMNQLSSRLLNSSDEFQQALNDLLFRICCDHPFHSLYQLFAVSKTKAAQNDSIAASRHESANKLAERVWKGPGSTVSAIWVAIHNGASHFVNFASEKLDKDIKTGSKLSLRNFKYGPKLESSLSGASYKIPPPTMNIPLRKDKDYSSLPAFSSFEQQFSVAGGVSAPKIVTMLATDGSRHKMLLKGGNDDLRQDAIMEQVFAQVSDLLQDHRPTRQRNLGIRTYKVIPLTHNAGIIEFVQNTTPLHEFLLPAHARYFPKDLKSNNCRKYISDASGKKPEDRLKAFKYVVDHFHPVMRFFFMERFLDPDKWFQKRLNYSRTTAAISMLGHVLGLGDRHGHNILLDELTGEVVHIDLGVAFEAGRILPIPEVVPFRLTRDLVDGMGISGVEGPFRRCCTFTLEALRKSQDAIMTILDVLRYDPLYSWSTSPLRVQRMQEQQEREAAAAASSKDDESVAEAGGGADERPKVSASVNEPGEADRALAVVAKKLSATLSVEATVNELIRQATDERNLAALYCGWGAYA